MELINCGNKQKMLFSVFSGLLFFASLCSASELDNAVLEKLLELENKLVEQETKLTKLADQETQLRELNTKLADQGTKLTELNTKGAEQETKLREQELRITDQELVNANQQRLIDQQQHTITKQQQTIDRMDTVINRQSNADDRLGKQPTVQDTNRCEDCNKDMMANSTQQSKHTRNIEPSLRVRQQPERVAFTAFLDYDLAHLGVNHPIAYNQVLLNEGSAYHPSTGIFYCPMDGLYVFYFSIATWGVRQDIAKLVVEGVNQVDAISDTYHSSHDAQGANFAVLSLRQGQQVWVAAYGNQDQTVHSKDIYRFATFSGFLLY